MSTGRRALEIKQQPMGLLTLADFWGCRSKSSKKQVDQGIAEAAYKWNRVLEASGLDTEENPSSLEPSYPGSVARSLGTGSSWVTDR